MTRDEFIAKIRKAGILALQKQEIEADIKLLKTEIALNAHNFGHMEQAKSGNSQLVVDGISDFSCKVYNRTQLSASQEKARELLHPNTFNAIFSSSTSEVVDIRPTAETKRKGAQLIAGLSARPYVDDDESKVA